MKIKWGSEKARNQDCSLAKKDECVIIEKRSIGHVRPIQYYKKQDGACGVSLFGRRLLLSFGMQSRRTYLQQRIYKTVREHGYDRYYMKKEVYMFDLCFFHLVFSFDYSPHDYGFGKENVNVLPFPYSLTAEIVPP